MSKKWTDGEVEMLRRHYPREGSRWDGWEKLLPLRSVHSIEHKAHKEGLAHQRFWTDEEDEVLRLYYEKKDAGWDGWRRVLPGKTRRQVVRRANFLGMTSPRYGWNDAERKRLLLAVRSVSEETGHSFLGCVKELNNLRYRAGGRK